MINGFNLLASNKFKLNLNSCFIKIKQESKIKLQICVWWTGMIFSCPGERTLCFHTTSYIHSSVLSLWNFPQDIGCRDPPLWPSLHYRLFIAAWLISGNIRSHLHLFYWWALLWRCRSACPLHNRTQVVHVCVLVQTGGVGALSVT